jgi:hypothetical protein
MVSDDIKHTKDYKERKEKRSKERYPVTVDIKDDLSDPVKGLPKSKA